MRTVALDPDKTPSPGLYWATRRWAEVDQLRLRDLALVYLILDQDRLVNDH